MKNILNTKIVLFAFSKFVLNNSFQKIKTKQTFVMAIGGGLVEQSQLDMLIQLEFASHEATLLSRRQVY